MTMPKTSLIVPKLGRIFPVLGIAAFVASCATAPAPGFQGRCILQPVASQDGLILANVQCEAK